MTEKNHSESILPLSKTNDNHGSSLSLNALLNARTALSISSLSISRTTSLGRIAGKTGTATAATAGAADEEEEDEEEEEEEDNDEDDAVVVVVVMVADVDDGATVETFNFETASIASDNAKFGLIESRLHSALHNGHVEFFDNQSRMTDLENVCPHGSTCGSTSGSSVTGSWNKSSLMYFVNFS